MQQQRPRARKEALFVRVTAPDETVEFHDVTSFVGKAMPFKNPRATLAMRVTDASVAFSLLHLTKRAATGLIAKPIEFPRGPLARLERRVAEIAELAQGEMLVEVNGEQHRYIVERDANGVAELVGEDGALDLPKNALQITLHFRSPIVERPLVIGFIGHVGKPETTETVRRAASMVLFSMTQLPQFRVLSELETVRVPAAPRAVVRPSRKNDERATVEVPVWLFTADAAPQLAGQGNVVVEVNLEEANPTTGRLLLQLTPSAEIAEVFDAYRTTVDRAVTDKLRAHLGDDEMKLITVDIVMGEVSSGTIERLREALATVVAGFDAAPAQYRDHV